jgi:hypothetical protein
MGEYVIPSNLYDYIELQTRNNGMFIGSRNVTALWHHIGGFQMACITNGIKEQLDPDFSEFHAYVLSYYMLSSTTRGWHSIILALNYGNEEQAWEEFHKIFALFRQKVKQTNAKAILVKILEMLLLNEGSTKH